MCVRPRREVPDEAPRARQRVGAKRVDEVYGRFRCKHCNGRPVRVGIMNGPARGTMYPDTWTVMLVDRQAG